MNLANILSGIPEGLRKPLLSEYRSIVHNFLRRKWQPAELSGGLFSEIVYTILAGYADGKFPASPSKPKNFLEACRLLETKIKSPRSLQILIPRILVALYEVRNNRSVGHVGGDVDPNQMDATAVLFNASWVMAELVRVFHKVSVADATTIVNSLVERKVPLVWDSGDVKRVLNTSLNRSDQVLVLLAACDGPQPHSILMKWTEASSTTNFNKVLKRLHQSRHIEWDKAKGSVDLLPAGSNRAEDIIAAHDKQ